MTPAHRDRFFMTDFLNYQGSEENKALNKEYAYFGGVKFSPIDTSSAEAIQKRFSDLYPHGIENAIKTILDAGFKIQITDTGNSVRKVFIYKKQPQVGGQEKKELQVCARATQISEAFIQAISMYRETLAQEKSFNFNDWYGQDKPYANYLTGACYSQTRLDRVVDNYGVTVNMKKVGDHYRINYNADGKFATVNYSTLG